MITQPHRARRFAALSMLTLLVAAALGALPGDSPAVADEAPSIAAFVADMEAVPGFFDTYRTPAGHLYLEVTQGHFDKDFLVVVQMAQGIGESPLLTGFPLDSDTLTFRMRNEKIELVARNPYFRADAGTALARMVDLGFREQVVASFPPVAQANEEGRYLINATSLFVADWPNLNDALPSLYGTRFQLDPRRSTLTSVKGFPENVEIKVDLSFAAATPIPSQTLVDPKTLPIALHYSVLALPDEPMKPRLADDRVGYFTTTYRDYSKQAAPTNATRLVNRWRLEKQDPYAELSDPVEPIVFYLEDTIPEAYRPYIEQGVEAWNAAFERAGFSNAILARQQPDDPNWDPGDARYSTIRWMPSVNAIFAIGPSDVDPRSGEILNADILFASDWVWWLSHENKRLTDTAGLEAFAPESEAVRFAEQLNPVFAQRLCDYGSGMSEQLEMLRYTLMADGVVGADGEVPLAYVGEALREITMHEVGHTLGLRHNFKATSAVPNEHLHDVDYTQAHGVSVSVMDYNPANIALDREQQGEYYNSVVGDYDRWAIEWGYRPVGNETLAPHPELMALAARNTEPGHVYGTDEDTGTGPNALDPYINQYDLGADPIAYYQNLAQLVDRVWDDVEAKLIEDGDEYWPLRSAANYLFSRKFFGYPWQVKALGGVEVMRAHKGNDAGLAPFELVPAERQREALDYLLTLFETDFMGSFPKELLDKLTTERWIDWASSWQWGQRFTYPIHDLVTAYRAGVLNQAFWPERLSRIRDNAYRSDEAQPFTLDELFTGFTDAIWFDLVSAQAPENSFQRAIQSIHLDIMIRIATQETDGSPQPTSSVGVQPFNNDARALAFSELHRLHAAAASLLDAGDGSKVARAHLLEARQRIEKALEL